MLLKAHELLTLDVRVVRSGSNQGLGAASVRHGGSPRQKRRSLARHGPAWPSVAWSVARGGLGLLPRGAVWRQWLPVCWRPGVGVPSRSLRIPRPPPAPSPEARAEWGPQGASLAFSRWVWQLWLLPSLGAKCDLSVPCAPPSSKHQSPSPPPATAAPPGTKLLRGDALLGSPSTLPLHGIRSCWGSQQPPCQAPQAVVLALLQEGVCSGHPSSGLVWGSVLSAWP